MGVVAEHPAGEGGDARCQPHETTVTSSIAISPVYPLPRMPSKVTEAESTGTLSACCHPLPALPDLVHTTVPDAVLTLRVPMVAPIMLYPKLIDTMGEGPQASEL